MFSNGRTVHPSVLYQWYIYIGILLTITRAVMQNMPARMEGSWDVALELTESPSPEARCGERARRATTVATININVGRHAQSLNPQGRQWY